MSHKVLIRNIENFSKTLSAEQLNLFLDIMDGMTEMVEESHKLASTPAERKLTKKEQTSTTKLLH